MKPRPRAEGTSAVHAGPLFLRGRFPTIIDKGNTYVNYNTVKYLHGHFRWGSLRIIWELLIGQRDETPIAFAIARMKIREFGSSQFRCFAGDFSKRIIFPIGFLLS